MMTRDKVCLAKQNYNTKREQTTSFDYGVMNVNSLPKTTNQFGLALSMTKSFCEKQACTR
jgi:hypothetical protein